MDKAGNAAQSAKGSVTGVFKYSPSISCLCFFLREFILTSTVACAQEHNDISLPIHDKAWILFVSGEDQS